ncbi:MAG TPA: biotin--[acetyl-CoA-carboxylase] ligase [Chthoniobacterales bacterium]|jgi:BirA family biotin operon repressor/biotin-[acetyl-CoA-carboxylase] ligase|nr:biotin--[acetyl-CoA-carboxylase] ligase [Chthoniobacterales bacterium]
MSPPDRLIASELQASLGNCVIGRRIVVLQSTRSTNDFLRQMLAPELPEGFVVFAEEQTAGRGQRANRWHSAPHQGLWFSILLRPQIPLRESARLTSWAAEAAAQTMRGQLALEPRIKLPNDVYIGPRKVCGILIETKPDAGSNFTAIAGIGVNVNQPLEAFPEELRGRAGSLAMALGRQLNRRDFALALLRELDRSYATSFSQRR